MNDYQNSAPSMSNPTENKVTNATFNCQSVIIVVTRMSKQILEKFTELPPDKQLDIIQYVSYLAYKDTKDVQEDLNTFTPIERNEIIETIAHINHLRLSNSRSKFLELIEDFECPISLKRLYIQDEIIRQPKILFEYKWRIDISVPKTNAVLINMMRGDERFSFRMDISTYHKLRYNIALVLKELQGLKKRCERIKLI